MRGDDVTDEEAAAGLRAVVNICRNWGLSDDESAGLVGAAPRSFARWKAGASARLSQDQLTRLSNLVGIHKALRILFTDSPRSYAWITAPNDAFAGKTALAVMLAGGLPGIMRVRRYLDAVCVG